MKEEIAKSNGSVVNQTCIISLIYMHLHSCMYVTKKNNMIYVFDGKTDNRHATHIMNLGGLNSNCVVDAVNNDPIFIKQTFVVNSLLKFIIFM